MRIIAGDWRGRNIVAPSGETTRPTLDRTRERLFSMLASRLGDFDGLQVLDLFAGSGALGLEALSRGAAHCTFVEQDRAALDALEKNVLTLDAAERSDVRIGSVLALGPARKAYDLILMDPPYKTGAGNVALDKLGRLGWFAPSSWIAVETERREDVHAKDFEVDCIRNSGKAKITLLRPRTAKD